MFEGTFKENGKLNTRKKDLAYASLYAYVAAMLWIYDQVCGDGGAGGLFWGRSERGILTAKSAVGKRMLKAEG